MVTGRDHMEPQAENNLVTGPSQEAVRGIVRAIQEASIAFQIVSLNRQIEACQGLFAENPFIDLAILGQFKAGKSSFINSLVGRPVLPVGVTPVTTVITRLIYGPHDRATVTYFDGKQSTSNLPQLRNLSPRPRIRLTKRMLKSWISSYPLSNRTPGLGSWIRRVSAASSSTIRTYPPEWLPRVGAAIVAISSDRPLSENDLALIRQLMEFTPRVVLLLTKVDLLDGGTAKRSGAVLQGFHKARVQHGLPDIALLYRERNRTVQALA